ncbi:MAG: glycosyltransferase family 39 protein, partial [Planctomycetota bacterium]
WNSSSHRLHHARAADVAALLTGLELDNHPPLSFLILGGVRDLFGEGALLLRAPTVLAGLGATALAALAARRIAGGRGMLAAAVVAAGSGLALQTQSEARMYGLLALAVAGLLEATSARAVGSNLRLPWRAAVWVAIGLLSHYWFLYHLLLGALGLGLGLACCGRQGRARLHLAWSDLWPLLAGAAIAVPWYATGFLEQLTAHDLAPGGTSPDLGRLAWSYVTLLFFQLGSLPRPLGLTLVAVAAMLLAVALWGLLRELRGPSAGRRLFAALVLLTTFGLGPLGYLLSHAFERAGFNWTYLAGAVPALAVAVGIGLASLPARWSSLAIPATAAALAAGSLPLAAGPGTEDLRGAVALVVRSATPADGVLAVEWQPGFFPHGQAWRYYTRDLDADALPRAYTHDEHYLLNETPDDLPPVLWVVRRGLPLDAPLLVDLGRRYTARTSHDFGWGVSVERFAERER